MHALQGRTYDLWQLGRFRCILRAHEPAALRGTGGWTTLPRAKMEYLPPDSREAVSLQVFDSLSFLTLGLSLPC